MLKPLFLLLSYTWLACCIPPHPRVLAVRQEEQFLPQHLRSRALHNPHLRQVLPLASLLHSGEQLVYERDTDKVPRRQIYNLLTHSGLVSRQRFPFQGPVQQWQSPAHQLRPPPHFHDPPFFANPDLLQHL